MKRVKLLAAVLMVVLVFSGCMKEDAKIIVSEDGYVTMGVTVDIKKETCDKILKKIKANGDEISKSIAESFTKDMKVVTIDGVEFYEAKESEKKTYKEFMSTNSDDGTDVYVTKDTIYINGKAKKTSMTGDVNSKEMEAMLKASGVDASVINEAKDIKLTYSVEFDKNIESTNGIIDKDNPKKANYSITEGINASSITIFATTNKSVTLKDVQNYIKKNRTIAKPILKKVKADKLKKKTKKASITVKFKKVNGAEKYKIEYATNKKFKNSRVKITSKTTYKIKRLKRGKRYFVRVYAMKKNDMGKDVISKASNKKSVKIKK